MFGVLPRSTHLSVSHTALMAIFLHDPHFTHLRDACFRRHTVRRLLVLSWRFLFRFFFLSLPPRARPSPDPLRPPSHAPIERQHHPSHGVFVPRVAHERACALVFFWRSSSESFPFVVQQGTPIDTFGEIDRDLEKECDGESQRSRWGSTWGNVQPHPRTVDGDERGSTWNNEAVERWRERQQLSTARRFTWGLEGCTRRTRARDGRDASRAGLRTCRPNDIARRIVGVHVHADQLEPYLFAWVVVVRSSSSVLSSSLLQGRTRGVSRVLGIRGLPGNESDWSNWTRAHVAKNATNEGERTSHVRGEGSTHAASARVRRGEMDGTGGGEAKRRRMNT